MDFSRFGSTPLIDCHVHPWPPWRADKRLDEAALESKSCELGEVIKVGRLEGMLVYGNPDHSSLYLKAADSGHIYAGGYVPWSFEASNWREIDWSSYVEALAALGYDGFGEMGAKPVTRDKHTPLDSPTYEGFWDACEDEELPVVCHVGDPEEFWSEEKTPDWAKARGWGYFRGGYPAQSELYAEVENVLTRHPGVRIVFPHMLFLSPHIEALGDFFERYSNAYIDLAPGVELLHEVSVRRGDWKRFFVRHADRILIGTDIGMSKTVEEHLARVWMMRAFLETAECFHTPDEADELLTRYEEPFRGLDLPRAALEKIYSGNLRMLWGSEPHSVDIKAAASAAEKSKQTSVARALRKLH